MGYSARTLVEVLPMPAAIVDIEGTILASNGRWRQAADRDSVHSAEGHSFVESIADASVQMRLLEAVRTTGPSDLPHLIHYPDTDHVIRIAPVSCDCGTHRHLVSTEQRPAASESDDDGRARELREARALASAKSEFLGLLGHELRTPVTGVVGLVDLLRSLPLDQRVREVVDSVFRSTEILRCVIDDLLDLARLETGTLVLEERSFSLRSLVEEVTEPFQEQVRGKGVLLLAAVDPRTPTTVVSDAARLRQILTNLVSNAVAFTDRGEVVVTAERHTGDRLLITVRDTGRGLSVEDRERVLAPFVQGDSSPAREHGGAGLGLAIAARLVARMGGTMEMDSEPDAGTEFRVFLPVGLTEEIEPCPRLLPGADRVALAAPTSTSARALAWMLTASGATVVTTDLESLVAAPPETGVALWCDSVRDPGARGRAETLAEALGPDRRAVMISATDPRGHGTIPGTGLITAPLLLRRLVSVLNSERPGVRGAPVPITPFPGGRVLLAEDNEVNGEVFRRMIELLGAECVVVGEGEAAVAEATGERPFDAILMDVRMPRVDGPTATRRIRSAGVTTPILALSATGLPSDERLCRQAGMDGYLEKPINLPELRAALATYLEPPVAVEPGAGSRGDGASPEGADRPPRAERDRTAQVSVDLGRLRQLESELADRPLMVSTVSAFLAQLDERRNVLIQALGRHDREGLRRMAHTLKSASALLGANTLAEACASVEERAVLAPERELAALVSEVERATAGAELAMAAYLSEHEADGARR